MVEEKRAWYQAFMHTLDIMAVIFLVTVSWMGNDIFTVGINSLRFDSSLSGTLALQTATCTTSHLYSTSV